MRIFKESKFIVIRIETNHLSLPTTAKFGTNREILKELESRLKSGVYYDGQPFVDFENKQANWVNFSKGILSPSTTKIWEYVNFRYVFILQYLIFLIVQIQSEFSF